MKGEYDYLDIGSSNDTVTELLKSMIRLYGKIFISQPWRVGRLLLQVGDWSEIESAKLSEGAAQSNSAPLRRSSVRPPIDEYSDDGDEDLYEEPKPANSYAYRSNSSLGIRNSRREVDDYVENEDEEELDDEMSYFTSVGDDLSTRHIRTHSLQNPQKYRENDRRSSRAVASPRRPISRQASYRSNDEALGDNSKALERLKQFEPYVNRIQPLSTEFTDIIAAIHGRDGLRGIWRAVNTSFIIDAFQVTIEAWLSGFYSSLSGVPDPHFLDVAYSPTPGASLLTAVAAATTTAVILAPLSIIRTRLVTTTLATDPRSVRTSIGRLESWTCPLEVLFPTVLYASVTSLVRKSAGYVIHIVFGVDKIVSPVVHGLLTLAGTMLEVGVKLPLETMVRRAHMLYLMGSKTIGVTESTGGMTEAGEGSETPRDSEATRSKKRSKRRDSGKLQVHPEDLIVKPVAYNGVFSTVWSVVSGQEAVATLYRGWRVSVLGVLSEWGVEALDNQELGDKERF